MLTVVGEIGGCAFLGLVLFMAIIGIILYFLPQNPNL